MISIFPCPFLIHMFLCIYTVSSLIIQTDATNRIDRNQKEVYADLPLQNDLEIYLTTLEKAVEFAHQNKQFVDIHVCFGIFLVNVNLRSLVNKIFSRIPDHIRTRLNQVLNTNDIIMLHFQQMVDTIIEAPEGDELPEVYIAALFYKNEKTWSQYLQNYNPYLLKITKFYTNQQLEVIYSEWAEYVEKVFDFESAVPTAEQSIICQSKLVGAGDYINFESNWDHCDPGFSQCTKMLLNGTDYGYALTHRLLYLIMGRFSRGCTIINQAADKQLIDNICASMYNEADYIAQHNARMPYLLTSQMSLCSLEGHVQFLRRSWINTLINYQSLYGCFGRWLNVPEYSKPYKKPDDLNWLIHRRYPILGGQCNTQTTGTAISMLGATIRYIIIKYY